MKLNGMEVKNMGKDRVCIYGADYDRAIYAAENENRYFVKFYGEVVEVYRNAFGYSTTKAETTSTYIIDENNNVVDIVNNAIDAETAIIELEEQDKQDGLYKPGFYTYVQSENRYYCGDIIDAPIEYNEHGYKVVRAQQEAKNDSGMKQSKLIGKIALITNRDSIYFDEWGTITAYDGEVYYLAMLNDMDRQAVFYRDEFKISRKMNQ